MCGAGRSGARASSWGHPRAVKGRQSELVHVLCVWASSRLLHIPSYRQFLWRLCTVDGQAQCRDGF